MIGRSSLAVLLLAGAGLAAVQTSAQTTADGDGLREAVVRRYEVLPLRDGLALKPRNSRSGVQSIEISGGAIAIDGVPATGAELRRSLGADAEVVLQLSYLNADQRRRLFGSTPSAPAALPEPLERPEPPAAAAPPAPPELPELPELPDVPRRSGRRSGERVHIGRSVTVDADEIVDGDVVSVGGSAHVLGEVHGSVVSVGGSVTLGPRANVHRDITVVGGALRADPTARIGGEVHEVGFGAFGMRDWPRVPSLWWGTLGSAFALMSTLIRVAVLCLLAAIVILLAREHVDSVGLRAADDPLKAGGIGFLAQVLFVPVLVVVIILLVITIVGIPLLVFIPFAMLALGLIALVGFTAVAQNAGRFVAARLGWNLVGPYATTLAGILVLLSPLLLARLVGLAGGPVFPMSFGLRLIGAIVEYAAWTIGFGAATLVYLNRRRTARTLIVPGPV